MRNKYYYNYKICRDCGGTCCKSLPGSYHPEDIKRLFPADTLKQSVEKALKTGNISIDWWEGEKDEIYFLRPATKDKVGIIYDPSWGGECIFLTKEGCSLSEKNRPETCKRLEPKEGMIKCISHFKVSPKLAMANVWQKSGLDLGQFSYIEK